MKAVIQMLGEMVVYALILLGAIGLLGNALMQLTSY